jgi:hypothetical protein
MRCWPGSSRSATFSGSAEEVRFVRRGFLWISGDARQAMGDSNEYHKPYFPKKCVLENVTNLSHAITYLMACFSSFLTK